LSAYLLDSAIVSVVGIGAAALITAAGPTLTLVEGSDGTIRLVADPLRLVLQAVAVAVVSAAYFAWSWSRLRGASPAQRALGIRVIDAASGDHLPAGRAIVRWAAMGTPIGIGAAALVESPAAWLLVVVLAAAWTVALMVSTRRDERRRGLHDRLAGSVVVRSV
jgi:uncharacterized RDD family membrane protein YckC